ncbi:histidine kinase [Cytophagaceae bacterium DM2B3-1]|uniref:Histidine kinase n=1 Tax=Xanthocytophaga flava TaxID=3048013 RepID=A0ABT7CMW8_9BACT|nr:histidine kinase [Xanthocytophaga flavus]MDJ1494345.1 histidine kinase [Xanthocytophaga flavus]
MNSYNDRTLRLIGPLVVFMIGSLFFRLNIYFEHDLPFIIRFQSIAILYGYVCWNLSRWVILTIQKRYPGFHRTRQRLKYIALAFPLLVHIAYFLRYFTHLYINDQPIGWPTLADYTYTTGIQIFYHCIYVGVYEGLYVFDQWKIVYYEREKLLNIQWQERFESLKSQINPHFLFNSLNSLSSLIREQPEQAEKFLDEMSNVYRYLLRNNEQELVSLQTELQFVESYFHLLKTRYGESIQLKLENLNGYEQYLLPPLTLQILLENAVKHNSILKEQPLIIQIYVEKGYLVVQNNVQKKNLKVASNKVGLHNIITKYQLLKQPEPVIESDDVFFIIRMPLIGNEYIYTKIIDIAHQH